MRRAFAQGMESGMGDVELAVAARKRSLFALLDPGSAVLDVGIGTGPNLVYYPRDTRVTGLDPNEFMKPFAMEKARNLVTRGIQLDIVQGSAEAIPLADASFDAVVWYALPLLFTCLMVAGPGHVQECPLPSHRLRICSNLLPRCRRRFSARYVHVQHSNVVQRGQSAKSARGDGPCSQARRSTHLYRARVLKVSCATCGSDRPQPTSSPRRRRLPLDARYCGKSVTWCSTAEAQRCAATDI
jgi:Methyltransferase domain